MILDCFLSYALAGLVFRGWESGSGWCVGFGLAGCGFEEMGLAYLGWITGLGLGLMELSVVWAQFFLFYFSVGPPFFFRLLLIIFFLFLLFSIFFYFQFFSFFFWQMEK